MKTGLSLALPAEAPPLRFALGAELLLMARAAYADRLSTWKAGSGLESSARRADEKCNCIALAKAADPRTRENGSSDDGLED